MVLLHTEISNLFNAIIIWMIGTVEQIESHSYIPLIQTLFLFKGPLLQILLLKIFQCEMSEHENWDLHWPNNILIFAPPNNWGYPLNISLFFFLFKNALKEPENLIKGIQMSILWWALILWEHTYLYCNINTANLIRPLKVFFNHCFIQLWTKINFRMVLWVSRGSVR